MRNTTVLISGASVAGPALAYWLHRYGFDVTVVEKAPELREGGQAIDFKGQTHRTVIERMGILEELLARQTGKTDMVLVDEAGRERAFISGDFTGGDIEILRGDLAEVMYKRTAEHCEYLFGDTITALTETADGVHAEFEHAPARTFDLVFGCDGIHSRVRKLTFGPERDYVAHEGYYYCIAGQSHWLNDIAGEPDRARALAWHTPGRLAVDGGSKAAQLYMFASKEIDYSRDDFDEQREIVARVFAGMGGRVPEMLAALPQLGGFYLDSISKVSMKTFVKGRVALLGDSAYGHTLAGFGTGLAVVGAYVLAGELAAAGGDYEVAFANYEAIMKRYTKKAKGAQPGPFLAPKSKLGVKFRNWFLGSRGFNLMLKYGDDAANDIDLKNYPEIIEGR
ncbi:FAD-dependent monooxygenase [Nocardia inohanensis]|uniref:FAD-dependent monooxygenase n=1 Tax=Nocardia inohanensis TaxID=209246 RepID=UPI000831CD70|nr:FAD-dependent monooxygenase [Nocardia inohanensis]